ncbi:hypothetical protein N9V30_00560 [Candidatus Poseidoniales archaeon]|nr:hypothetical protein [Candidatus Poseidoniales archaeon]
MNYEVYSLDLRGVNRGIFVFNLQKEVDEYEFDTVEEMVKFARHMNQLVSDANYRPKRGYKKIGKIRIHEELFTNFTKLTNSLADLLNMGKQPDFSRVILFMKDEWMEGFFEEPYFLGMIKRLHKKWHEDGVGAELFPRIEIIIIDE